MIQRMELESKLPPNSKTQEENENEEMSLFNILNPGLAAGGFPIPTLLLLGSHEIGHRGVTIPPHMMKALSPPRTPGRAPNLVREHPFLEQNNFI